MEELGKLRYERNLLVSGFDEELQYKLMKSKVLVVGAGGLGSAVLSYLTASGIGTVGIVEFDYVEISNLQRQILYTESDLGNLKVDTASRRLKALNSKINIEKFNIKLEPDNAEKIISGFDVIVDCTDNYQTRYLIDKYCRKFKIPMVYGSAQETSGQISIFNYVDTGGYADLYPEIDSITNQKIGVLSPMPGIIGSMQAMEVIKLITGYGKTLIGKLLIIDNSGLNIQIFDI